jgi:hypothetical protein
VTAGYHNESSYDAEVCNMKHSWLQTSDSGLKINDDMIKGAAEGTTIATSRYY